MKGLDTSGRISAKESKSTRQGVIDPATSLILFKMVQNGTLSSIKRMIKTGKEACIFYAEINVSECASLHPTMRADKFINGCAVKIFKTTLNEFGNRADYYDGDHRFGKFKTGSNRESISQVSL